MKTMSSQAINRRPDNSWLKEPSGWFAAGASFRGALRTLSDGAFKLFAHLCLEADRRTGCYEAVQAELARAIGKEQLTRAWELAKPPKIGGCLDMPRTEIVQ